MARPQRDMTTAEIKFALSQKGWTYADVDRAYGLPDKIAAITARYPHSRGELAVAEVLGLSPRQIWPSRYDAAGIRLKPQPANNYKRAVSSRQDQKGTAA